MCRLRNIALESVTDGRTDRQTDRQTDGQSDPYVSLCFAHDTKSRSTVTKVELDLKFLYGSLLPTFIQVCERITKKSPEIEILTKGNNS